MKLRSNRPILVTGSNRCGSTWIGKTISHAPHVRYIHEPFNLAMAERSYGKELPRWFHYVTSEDEKYFREYLEEVFHIPKYPVQQMSNGYESKCLRSTASKITRYYMPWLRGVRPLMKDPIAVFSADWIASQFDIDVLIIVRHPAAYVWSLMKDPTHVHSIKSVFVAQPKLLGRISFLEDEIFSVLGDEVPIWKQATVFWKAIYGAVINYQMLHPEWLCYRYEDIASSPDSQFKVLCKQLKLDYTEDVKRVVQLHSLCSSSHQQDLKSHVKKCDSKNYVEEWKTHLDLDMIRSIRKIAEPISSRFYSSSDW